MSGDVDKSFAGSTTDGDISAFSLALGYEYALSKRTVLYTGAGYMRTKAELWDAETPSDKYE